MSRPENNHSEILAAFLRANNLDMIDRNMLEEFAEGVLAIAVKGNFVYPRREWFTEPDRRYKRRIHEDEIPIWQDAWNADGGRAQNMLSPVVRNPEAYSETQTNTPAYDPFQEWLAEYERLEEEREEQMALLNQPEGNEDEEDEVMMEDGEWDADDELNEDEEMEDTENVPDLQEGNEGEGVSGDVE